MKKFNLPKSIILKKNKTFTKVFNNGEKFSSQFFTAYITNENPLKIGFAAQKGTSDKPQRNRIKRLTRELWRTHYQDFNITCKMVIVAKKSIIKVDYGSLEQDFIKLLDTICNNIHPGYCKENNKITC